MGMAAYLLHLRLEWRNYFNKKMKCWRLQACLQAGSLSSPHRRLLVLQNAKRHSIPMAASLIQLPQWGVTIARSHAEITEATSWSLAIDILHSQVLIPAVLWAENSCCYSWRNMWSIHIISSAFLFPQITGCFDGHGCAFLGVLW